MTDHTANLHARLWDIANTLRGKMGADEFRDYILGFIFYKYLSEKMHSYADELLKPDGMGYMSLRRGRRKGTSTWRRSKRRRWTSWGIS